MEYDIEIENGNNKYYYKKGTKILHREDGPAIEWSDGFKAWYINGECHRVNGPAIELANGDRYWYINGKRLSPEKETILNEWWKKKNGI